MQELRLFAISINDVRDIFGADAALAARLRQVAAQHFAPPARRRSVLDRVGPMFSRHRPTEVDPNTPSMRDVDALLTGGHILQDRVIQCWQVMLVWLGSLASQYLTMEIDGMDRLEFDLARAGLPSDYSLRRLAERELGTSLRPLAGQVVGYSKHIHVVETHRQLRIITDGAPQEFSATMAAVAPLQALLASIASHAEAPTDLVVVQVPT